MILRELYYFDKKTMEPVEDDRFDAKHDQSIVNLGDTRKTRLTLKDIKTSKDAPLECFFKSNCFHIPSIEELLEWGNTEEEINNTQLVSDMCEQYKITGPPRLPNFECPNNMSNNDHLRHLCREGWKKRIRIHPKGYGYGEG
jgi:DNA polymerase III alpha subunit